MFAYCNNSPSNRTDPDGNSSLVIRPQVCITDPGDDTCGCGGFGGGGEIIPLGLLKLIVDIFTPSVNSVPEVYNPNANAKAIPQSEAKSIAITTEKVDQKKRKQVYFPEDPNLFVPFGLVRNDYPGGRNGAIIKWSVPGFKKFVIFEWDEDLAHGSHYHVMTPFDLGKHIELIHWEPGDPIPEPWNSKYFGYLGG